MTAMRTVGEYARDCNVNNVILRLVDSENMNKYVLREYIDTLYHMGQIKPCFMVPGSEMIIVDIIYPDCSKEPPDLKVFFTGDGKTFTLNYEEMEIETVSRMYVSANIIKKYGTDPFLREIVYCLTRKKAEFLLKREKITDHLEKDDLKDYVEVNEVLHMLHVTASKDTYDTKELKQEMEENFGRVFCWRELMAGFKVTEDLCGRLLPYNPPSLMKLQKMHKRILGNKDIWGEVDFFPDQSIVVEPFRIRQEVPPFVYVQGRYEKTTLWDYPLEEILMMPVVARDHFLCNNKDLLCGILLLYIAYPVRMKRETKRDAIGLLANIMAQKAKQSSHGIAETIPIV